MKIRKETRKDRNDAPAVLAWYASAIRMAFNR